MKKLLTVITLLYSTLTFGQQSADLLLRDVNIIDVATGRITPHQAILLQKDVIVKVINDADAAKYPAARTVSASGKYAIPGLWDMHMHFGGGDTLAAENKNLLPLFLAHGITTVRDAAADISPLVLQWRNDINTGKLTGPTIFTSGPKLEGYKSIWRGDLEIGTTAELDAALDSLQQLKVDFVKITDNTILPALYLESVRKAGKRGFRISGHVPYALTMQQVSDAGLSSVEHLGYAWKAGVKDEAALSREIAAGTLKGREVNRRIMETFDTATALRTYRMMAKNGTAVTPTLNISYTVAYLDKDDHAHDPYLAYIGKGLQRTYEWRVKRAAQDDSAAIAWRHEVFERTAGILPLLQKAGVRIMAGTDAGYLNSHDYPGIGLHQELALLVKYGLTPLQALQASVINSPAWLGKTNYGSISKNKKADILLLNANPLQDIHATQKIHAVIVKGKILERPQLDAMLEEVKTVVANGK